MRRVAPTLAACFLFLILLWLAVAQRYSYQQATLVGYSEDPCFIRVERLTGKVEVLTADRGWVPLPKR